MLSARPSATACAIACVLPNIDSYTTRARIVAHRRPTLIVAPTPNAGPVPKVLAPAPLARHSGRMALSDEINPRLPVVSATEQRHLQRTGVHWPGEDVVGVLHLIQAVPVRDQPVDVEPPAGEHP